MEYAFGGSICFRWDPGDGQLIEVGVVFVTNVDIHK